MDAEGEIYRYSKDFGITEKQIRKSIEETAAAALEYLREFKESKKSEE